MNRWGIPKSLEKRIQHRDKKCVYCGVRFSKNVRSNKSKKAFSSWEHIVNDASIITYENIALCCLACNASKGAKRLNEWLESSYCKKRKINKHTIALTAKKALRKLVTGTFRVTVTKNIKLEHAKLYQSH